MGQQFIPTETFEAKVNGHLNRYIKGEKYTVYDTPAHQELARKVQQWIEEDKVMIIGTVPESARPATIKTGKKRGK